MCTAEGYAMEVWSLRYFNLIIHFPIQIFFDLLSNYHLSLPLVPNGHERSCNNYQDIWHIPQCWLNTFLGRLLLHGGPHQHSIHLMSERNMNL